MIKKMAGLFLFGTDFFYSFTGFESSIKFCLFFNTLSDIFQKLSFDVLLTFCAKYE
jgi:hypothetical protein